MSAGSLRRSSRLSAVQPQASPCYLSPRRVTRRSLALAPVPASPALRALAPSYPSQSPVQAPKPVCGSPPSSQEEHAVKASLGFTPAKEALPGGRQPEAASECSSVTEERAAGAADVVLPSILTLSPRASPSRASISPRPPAEAQNTSAVEVTNLALPTFLLIHRTRPLTCYSTVNLGNTWPGF